MRRGISLVALSVILLGGCSSIPGHGIKPEPVSFTHPDEVVKGEGFMALADRRVFAVMAFLNATGYDKEAKGRQMHPVRVKVRALVAANLAEYQKKLKAWRKYRKGFVRKYMQTYNYQNYVLSLSADYPFRRIRTDKELNYSYTAWIFKDLPLVLNDFWETAKLGEVWEQVKPDYIAEIKKYDFKKMKGQMEFLWRYLRMERQDTLMLVNVPNVIESHFEAIGARYENYYYTVESPGSHGYALNIHEYLHSIVNRIVKANYQPYRGKLLKYYNAGRKGPLSKSYGDPVGFTSECLVRALDRRISIRFENDPKWTALRESQVAQITKGGLNLTQPFYNLLTEYEKSCEPFDEFLPAMLEQLPAYTR